MFAPSRYPTRLLLRCPVCYEYATVLLSDHAHRQTFCPRDGVPMTVLSVAAGCTTPGGDWPDVFGTQRSAVKFELAAAV